MRQVRTTLHRGQFRPVSATRRAQMAMMELRPGETSDDELSNEHPRCEQWLYVVQGTGRATVVPRNGRQRQIKLRRGSLLVIEAGERHQIRNTGRKRFITVNFYVPPAYGKQGDVLPRARSRKR